LGALTTACAREFGSVGGGLFETLKVVVKRIMVIEFGVNDGGGNGRGCFAIEVRDNAAELTNMIAA